jgi:hypothetical protein
MALGPLFPNSDTIKFDDEQLPVVMVHKVCKFRYAVSLAMSLGTISEWLRICNETIPL